MPPSDSEDETLEEAEFEGDDEQADGEDDIAPEDATDEGDDNTGSEDEDEGSDDDDEEDNEDSDALRETPMEVDPEVKIESIRSRATPSPTQQPPPPEVSALTNKRSLSPAHLRRKALIAAIGNQAPPGSYSIEAICALPHPVPTHALASSLCMTHLLTGSDDGYIRDYDVFAAVNSKIFLTAPQRHHSGVVEGIMKAGQLRCWWENPAQLDTMKAAGGLSGAGESPPLSPVYSLAMHSDALWTLAGTDAGHINLFTTRHEQGRLIHVMPGHRGPVSGLSMDYDQKGFFSAGWDGDAIQWDLNNGHRVRNFTAHGAQLAAIALRPLTSGFSESRLPSNRAEISQTTDSSVSQTGTSDNPTLHSSSNPNVPDSDAKSDVSFDPLFDDVPEAADSQQNPSSNHRTSSQPARATGASIPPPKNAPPLLNSSGYSTYSPDVLMTAFVDGQVILWDKRVHTPGKGVGRLWMSEKTPPWCLSACWSADGGQIYAGRRNGTIDVWDVRLLGSSGLTSYPRLLKTLRNPVSSGVVSCVVALPDCRHIACASIDNLRLWNVAEVTEPEYSSRGKSGVQFKIIPGHHGGYVSQLLVDSGARFLVSASSNRGWHGESTRTVFVHDIKRV